MDQSDDSSTNSSSSYPVSDNNTRNFQRRRDCPTNSTPTIPPTTQRETHSDVGRASATPTRSRSNLSNVSSLGSPSIPITRIRHKKGSKELLSIICQVCLQPRNYKKYRRHLRYHFDRGEICREDINEIIFQSKASSRSIKSSREGSLQTGWICSFETANDTCGAYVQYLHNHLARKHGLMRSDKMYSTALSKSKPVKRIVHYPGETNCVINPIFKITSVSSFELTKRIASRVFNEENNHQLVDLKNGSDRNKESDTFSPLSEDDDSQNDINYGTLVKKFISEEMYIAVRKFSKFLLSVYGGSKSIKSVNMDSSNIFKLINGVGENKIFNSFAINSFISEEISRGGAPSTSYSRLKSLRQFMRYLEYHHRSLIPQSLDLNQYLGILKGLEQSILKLRSKRNKLVMSRSRSMFRLTLKTLADWRKARNCLEFSTICDSHRNNSNLTLDRETHQFLLGFFILEILIPNGQRPGIIQGIVVDEVYLSEKDIIEGVHRIFISEHKTGAIQPATIFLYPDIFSCLFHYVKYILPKLPKYQEAFTNVNGESHVFQTYGGKPLCSSRITPIFRDALKRMNISCKGTITDFRKASVSLTGKFCPELHEIMAQFFCHSRNVHEKNYKMQLGHSGLIRAFKALEKMQSTPLSPIKEMPTLRAMLMPISTSHDEEALDASCPILNYSGHGEFESISEDLLQVVFTPDVSQTGFTLDELQVVDAPDVSQTVFTPNDPQVVDAPDVSQIVFNPYISEVICTPNVANIVSTPIVSKASLNPDISLENETQFSRTRIIEVKSNANLKDFSIDLFRLTPAPKHTFSNLPYSQSPILRPSHHRSIFRSFKDEELFHNIFDVPIKRVRNRQYISKREIIAIANFDTRYKRLEKVLQFRYPNENIMTKLYMKVRTIGLLKRAK